MNNTEYLEKEKAYESLQGIVLALWLFYWASLVSMILLAMMLGLKLSALIYIGLQFVMLGVIIYLSIKRNRIAYELYCHLLERLERPVGQERGNNE